MGLSGHVQLYLFKRESRDLELLVGLLCQERDISFEKGLKLGFLAGLTRPLGHGCAQYQTESARVGSALDKMPSRFYSANRSTYFVCTD